MCGGRGGGLGLIMASRVPRSRRKSSFSRARRTDGAGRSHTPPPFPANRSRSGETGSAALGRRLLDGRLNVAGARKKEKVPVESLEPDLSHNHWDRRSETLPDNRLFFRPGKGPETRETVGPSGGV